MRCACPVRIFCFVANGKPEVAPTRRPHSGLLFRSHFQPGYHLPSSPNVSDSRRHCEAAHFSWSRQVKKHSHVCTWQYAWCRAVFERLPLIRTSLRKRQHRQQCMPAGPGRRDSLHICANDDSCDAGLSLYPSHQSGFPSRSTCACVRSTTTSHCEPFCRDNHWRRTGRPCIVRSPCALGSAPFCSLLEGACRCGQEESQAPRTSR